MSVSTFETAARNYTNIKNTGGKNMSPGELDFLIDVWAFDVTGKKVHPYKGVRGDKKGLFSVNFTNDTKRFQGMTEDQLVAAINAGKFKDRGSIRMLPIGVKPGSDRNAYSPVFYQGKRVKEIA